MAEDPRQAKRERIEAAAYEVLRERGYRRASMLEIARKASASNETLYNWYGNKQALFRALVEANARQAFAMLAEALRDEMAEPMASLAAIAPEILTVVTGERAVMLNRAAAGDVDDTASLGTAIAAAGRETIMPMVRSLIEKAHAGGTIACDDAGEATEVFISLLVGDTQIRRVIGVMAEPDVHAIRLRAERATRHFRAIYAVSGQATPT